jgi:outer membrane protein OmpA-like peptidoglycan-associated protein
MPKTTILIILIFILSTGMLHAETIKQRSYNFQYDDGAMGMPDQTYLICKNCPDDKPTIIPNLVAHASAVVVLPQSAPSIDKALVVKATSLVQPACFKKKDEVSAKPVAKKVHFGFDSAVLLPGTISILDRIEAGKALHLKGYSCTIGTADYNLALSQRRADAVSNYLKKRGISILTSTGFGKSTLYPDKALNRRVEIIENKENNGS